MSRANKVYHLSIRAYFPGMGNYTTHYQDMDLKDRSRTNSRPPFQNLNIIAIKVIDSRIPKNRTIRRIAVRGQFLFTLFITKTSITATTSRTTTRRLLVTRISVKSPLVERISGRSSTSGPFPKRDFLNAFIPSGYNKRGAER